MKKKTHKHIVRKMEISARRDWHVVVVVFAILNISIIGMSLYFYLDLNKNGFFDISDTAVLSSETIDHVEFKEVVDTIVAQRARFNDLTNNPLVLIDPSR